MTRRLRRFAPLSVIALALTLAACGDDGSAPAPAESAPVATAAPAAPVDDAPAAPVELDEASLREAARLALAEERVYAPAGDNAIDHYLALSERHPAETGLREALVDLAPYALIAAERAIAAGDLGEGERLAGQLARIDAEAPALPRLRQAIEDARRARAEADAEAERRAQAAAEAASAAAAAQAAAAVAPPAATPATLPDVAPPTTATASPPAAASASPPAETAPAPAPVQPPAPVPVPAAAAPEEPRAIATPAPRYPPQAQRRRIEGEVRVMFTVGTDGAVSGVEVESATPPDVFDREAIAAVSRWRFAPVQAPVRVRRTLRFRLPEAR